MKADAELSGKTPSRLRKWEKTVEIEDRIRAYLQVFPHYFESTIIPIGTNGDLRLQ